MVGGTIVQVLPRDSDDTQMVEVLDETYFGRCWRTISSVVDIHEGDHLWWMSHRGYHTRLGEFVDQDIGRCTHATYRTAETEPEGGTNDRA